MCCLRQDAMEAVTEMFSPLATEELRNLANQRGLACGGEASREVLVAALAPYAKGITHRWPGRTPVPLKRPIIAFSDLRALVPKHCFERSLLHGLTTLTIDLLQIAGLGAGMWWITQQELPFWALVAAWVTYSCLQGFAFVAIGVLAHDCGHHAFCDNEFLNDAIGTLCNSLILIPYHALRITHDKHHKNCGNLDHDEQAPPRTRADMGEIKMGRARPLWKVPLRLVARLLLGVLAYVLFNLGGAKKHRGTRASHYNPWSPFIDPKDRLGVIVSILACDCMWTALGFAISKFGLATVARYYVAPFVVMLVCLSIQMYLSHNDVFVPYMRGSEWEFYRGALCTVDRSWGPLLNHMFHHLPDTHLCHHLFSRIPFYHTKEATEVIAKALGPWYQRDDTFVLKAFWRAFRCCDFVEDVGGVVFYKTIGFTD